MFVCMGMYERELIEKISFECIFMRCFAAEDKKELLLWGSVYVCLGVARNIRLL